MESPLIQTVLWKFGIDSLDADMTREDTNELFELLYGAGDGEVREIIKSCFLNKNNIQIDPNYGDNLAAIHAAQIGDTPLLDTFIDLGMSQKVKREVMGVAAKYNQPECVDLLIRKGNVDARWLLDHSGYNRPAIREVVDRKLNAF